MNRSSYRYSNRFVRRNLWLVPLVILWQLVAISAGSSTAYGQVGSAKLDIEMQFLEYPQVTGNVVRMEDIVQVRSAQEEIGVRLRRISLGPAPFENQGQTWTKSEILKHLELRGIPTTAVRWSGKETTQVRRQSAGLAAPQKMMPAFLQQRTVTQANRILEQAISEYVQVQAGDGIEWTVEVQVPTQYVRALQAKRNVLAIGGGKPPWEGKQQFSLRIADRGEQITIPVDAVLKMPPMVVAAARPIRRDELLTAKALTYKSLSGTDENSQKAYFFDINEVVGKQARRAISTGLPVTDDFLGAPTLVKRGAIVTLESVAGTIVVRTPARSMGSGAANELIEVQVIDTRQKLYATVIDPVTVRIVAQPTRTR